MSNIYTDDEISFIDLNSKTLHSYLLLDREFKKDPVLNLDCIKQLLSLNLASPITDSIELINSLHSEGLSSFIYLAVAEHIQKNETLLQQSQIFFVYDTTPNHFLGINIAAQGIINLQLNSVFDGNDFISSLKPVGNDYYNGEFQYIIDEITPFRTPEKFQSEINNHTNTSVKLYSFYKAQHSHIRHNTENINMALEICQKEIITPTFLQTVNLTKVINGFNSNNDLCNFAKDFNSICQSGNIDKQSVRIAFDRGGKNNQEDEFLFIISKVNDKSQVDLQTFKNGLTPEKREQYKTSFMIKNTIALTGGRGGR